MLMAIYHVRMKYPGQEEETAPPAETEKPPQAYPASLRQEGVLGIPEQSIRVVPEGDDDELHEQEQQNGHLPTMGDPSRRARSEEASGDGVDDAPRPGKDTPPEQETPTKKPS